jgi:hypothetical protein
MNEFLFTLPDDYALFFFVIHRPKTILTGNPGISKSWFQWKYNLFCYRPDLYNKLCQLDFIRQTKEYELEQAKKGYRNKGTIPDVIVRTVNGTMSYLFFVNLPMAEVI